jgi:heme-dependent oxidative N-demethylase alpha subunit-like protein
MELGEPELPKSLPLEGLFSRHGYRPTMALKRLRPEEYFNHHGPLEILKHRRALLEGRPYDFVCEPPTEEDCVAVIRFASNFAELDPVRTFRELGSLWEPDYVLLLRTPWQKIVGGCVCFPTGWTLEEKQNHPLAFAHAPVPGLEAQLGPSIERFFVNLKPQECYQRSNWSLTSSRQMNQRPQDGIAEIGANCQPDRTYLRVEWQALMSIDPLRDLFGIRIYHLTLETVCQHREAANLLAENLLTMPAEMLEYKRLAKCRDRIAELLS